MTTPPQPPVQSGRGRKRPAPGASAPLVSSNPSTSGPAAPVTDMNYYGSLPTTSAGGSNGNLYSSDPATSISAQQLQSDIYRLQTAQQQQQQLHQQQPGNIYDSSSQLARVARGNQLMRVPTFGSMNVAPGIPPQISGLPPQMPMNMNIMGAPGMMGLSGGFEQPVSASEAIDRELCARIESIKKKRSNIPPFVLKLSSFVNDPNSDDLIRWSDSGSSFMVLDEEEFSKKLIPDLFKHNNYASFVRQLNMYGFHKVVGLADGSLKTSEQRSKPPSEYENPYFKRGQPDLMWLIQKPKSKNARAKGKKGVKQEEQDTDKEENMSDAGGESGDIGGGYLEGPKDANEPQTHSAGGGGGGSRNRSVDFSALVAQIEAVRSHQIMISQAINRLRKDHQQLYEQSLAFQSLHDRHENSINAILTFLATVYDKSLGGHINGAVNNLFSHQVDQGQGLHRGPPGSNVGAPPTGAIIPTAPASVRPAVMRTPQMARRKPLLLEGGPTFSSGDSSPMNGRNPIHKGNGGSPQVTHQQHLQQEGYQSYQHNTPITELFTPAGGNVTSPADSPQPQHADQHLGVNPPNTTGLYSQPTTPAPTPQTNYASPNMQTPLSNHTTPVPIPRSIARALGGTPFQSTAQALHEHNASLAQKSHEIEELEVLQAKQNENIDNLMGILHGYVDTDSAVGTGGGGAGEGAGGGGVDGNSDLGPDEVDQFFNFSLQPDGFVDNPFGDDDPHGNVDIDELLRNVEAEGNSNGFNSHNNNPVLTDLTSSAASPTGSSVGSRAREEIEEEIEEVTPKRRRVN